jgi:glutathione S-transferase
LPRCDELTPVAGTQPRSEQRDTPEDGPAAEGACRQATDKQREKARTQIRERLTQLAPIFLKNKYMLGDDFSMLVVAIA